jgi:hypothetical protein
MFVILRSVVAFFLLLGIAAAMPAKPLAGPNCKPNVFEHFNLAHHHDVNTGKVIVGHKIVQTPINVGGSGCSPIWAGGAYDDSAHFKNKKYPAWLQSSGGAAPAAEAAGPAGDGMAMPSE